MYLYYSQFVRVIEFNNLNCAVTAAFLHNILYYFKHPWANTTQQTLSFNLFFNAMTCYNPVRL